MSSSWTTTAASLMPMLMLGGGPPLLYSSPSAIIVRLRTGSAAVAAAVACCGGGWVGGWRLQAAGEGWMARGCAAVAASPRLACALKAAPALCFYAAVQRLAPSSHTAGPYALKVRRPQAPIAPACSSDRCGNGGNHRESGLH
eukprot:scaffold1333_cov274-Prasinococcus_capsulatus_cf.AAC.6